MRNTEVIVSRSELMEFYDTLGDKERIMWFDFLAAGIDVVYIMNYIKQCRAEIFEGKE
jgi:hypothetical protein